MDTSYLLEPADVLSYLARLPHIAARLGDSPAHWDIEEISDGNVNHVFAVHGTHGSVCVKQAPPYVRAVGSEWPLTPERISFEYQALIEHRRHAARFLPQPLHYDASRKLMIVEYLAGYHIVRDGLTAGGTYTHFADEIAGYLAATLFFTSDFALPSPRKRDLVRAFEENSAMCEIMEDMIFTEIYASHPRNQWTTPWLDRYVKDIQHDTALKLAVSALKLKYMTCKQALLHGDLHTGSIMASATSIRVIDQEFACFGPIAYDIGTLIAHLMISYFARDAGDREEATRREFQSWSISTIEATWDGFRSRFLEQWEATESGDAYPPVLFSDASDYAMFAAARAKFMDDLLVDAIRFCGAEILRRVIGFASVSDFTAIRDGEDRAACELRSLALAREVLAGDHDELTIATLIEMAKRIRREVHLCTR